MRRTQIYLDEDIYRILQLESKMKKTRISNLIREALRDRYLKSDSTFFMIEDLCGIWEGREITVAEEPGKKKKKLS